MVWSFHYVCYPNEYFLPPISRLRVSNYKNIQVGYNVGFALLPWICVCIYFLSRIRFKNYWNGICLRTEYLSSKWLEYYRFSCCNFDNFINNWQYEYLGCSNHQNFKASEVDKCDIRNKISCWIFARFFTPFGKCVDFSDVSFNCFWNPRIIIIPWSFRK